MTFLADSGKKVSTIRSYVSAIKHKLRADGVDLEDRAVILASIVKAVKLKNDKLFIRLPIQKNLLTMILDKVDILYNEQPYLAQLYKTMLSFGYYALLRVGEMATGDYAVKAKDIRFATGKDRISIIIRRSKTLNPGSPPQVVKIPNLTQQQEIFLYRHYQELGENYLTRFDPVTITREFCSMRPHIADANEPFFVFRDRSPVTPVQYRSMLKKVLQMANLEVSLYSGHSTRAGRACDYAKLGIDMDRIRKFGRWSPRSSAVFQYTRHA